MKLDERYPRPLDAELLRSFLAVAECANVTRAASVLGRTQSAISVQLRRLEDELGVSLFNRQARGVALTPAGEQLVPMAIGIVGDLHRLRTLFDSPMEGRIRVGIPDDYDQGVLRDILKRFTREHPGVEVFVRCALGVAFPEAIRNGELDLAVYAAEPGERVGRKLDDEPLVWAAHSSWTRSQDEPVPLALFDRACWWRSTATDALARAGVPYRTAFESESAWGVTAAIASGLAVGVLAAGMLGSNMRVVGREDGLPRLPKTRLVLLANEQTNSPASKAMRDAIVGQFTARGRRT